MLDETACETKRLLVRTNGVCKLICLLMKVVFVAMCVWWLVATAIMAISVSSPESLGNVHPVSAATMIGYVFSYVVMAVICITLIKIFSDASKGHSPFTMLQVKRLRLVAGMLLAYAVLEFLVTYSASFLPGGWIGSSANGAAITIDFFTIVAAAVIYAFSFVFKYGVLLQEFSDDAI